ncbi:cbb3-type cytochrome oxidase assembly protein CcoS [Sunxiuqinia elliptica]|uniref:Cbb3-type cytochrome oxidase maturation protein n=1 Tax=Sunxiuqinia elliptica TaxID=655355 RepID=A0A4R6GM49_9BACT|nr:cbb3-type cytochrome oxidase assembly protein CcoS [Sunxiuqinia elliptica]TDN96261.1 cbb3-type cytochrome oxidase maturation protein [Sunxiuqinia elliptica]TDO67972.1 cbb3-type cytochrome oxidase maturation protein [Sunxiuqinia elliptica]
MSVVFVLIIIGILVASVFLIAFIWAVKNGQFEDSYTPSVRILFDDPISSEENDDTSEQDNKHEKKSIKS